MTAPLCDESDVIDQMGPVKTADLTALDQHIETASRLLTAICIPLQPATITDRLNGGQGSVLLSTYPVNAITSVTAYDASGTATTLAEAGGTTGLLDGWQLDPSAGVLHRVGYRAWPVGWGNVVVVYTVGPAAIPADVTMAAVLLTEHLWQFRKISRQPAMPGNDPQGFSAPYAIPNKVMELIRDYLKPPRAA